MLYPGAPLAIKYTTPAAIVAPMICEIQYPSASRALILLATSMPKVTAGLMWQPETGPRAKAMAINASPNANATPTFPTWEPAITAVPTPARTRTNVPNNSAAYFIGVTSARANFLIQPNGKAYWPPAFGFRCQNACLIGALILH